MAEEEKVMCGEETKGHVRMGRGGKWEKRGGFRGGRKDCGGRGGGS